MKGLVCCWTWLTRGEEKEKRTKCWFVVQCVVICHLVYKFGRVIEPVKESMWIVTWLINWGRSIEHVKRKSIGLVFCK